MAFSPIAFIAPNYRDYKTYWLKAYEPGTTTPKTIALSADGSVLVIKVQLNADGFPVSAGGAIVIPYIDGPYDLWLFPDASSADANDTSGAERLADNIVANTSNSISAQEFGAVADGSTDDSVSVSTAMTSSVSSGDFLTNDLALGSFIGSGVSLPANLNMSYGKYKSDQAQMFFFPANSSSVDMAFLELSTEAGSNGIAIQQNSANCSSFRLALSRITADGYGLLSNQSASGTDGALIIGNFINSTTSDAIEWNHPNEDVFNFLTSSCILEAGSAGTSPSSGFAYGVAGTKGHIGTGLMVKTSRQEAFHFEDGQERGVLVAATAQDCLEDCIHILPSDISRGDGPADGVITVGVHGNHSGIKTGFHGYHNIFNVDGSLKNNIANSLYMKGFDSGYQLGQDNFDLVDNVVAKGCNIAISTKDECYQIGAIVSDDCATLASGGRGARIDAVFSQQQPANVLVKNGAGVFGPRIKNFGYSIDDFTNTAGVTSGFKLFTLPDLMRGEIVVTLSSGSNLIIYRAMVEWDGATLTESELLTKTGGTISSPNVANVGGDLHLEFFGSAANSYTNIKFEFDGFFYVHN